MDHFRILPTTRTGTKLSKLQVPQNFDLLLLDAFELASSHLDHLNGLRYALPRNGLHRKSKWSWTCKAMGVTCWFFWKSLFFSVDGPWFPFLSNCSPTLTLCGSDKSPISALRMSKCCLFGQFKTPSPLDLRA